MVSRVVREVQTVALQRLGEHQARGAESLCGEADAGRDGKQLPRGDVARVRRSAPIGRGPYVCWVTCAATELQRAPRGGQCMRDDAGGHLPRTDEACKERDGGLADAAGTPSRIGDGVVVPAVDCEIAGGAGLPHCLPSFNHELLAVVANDEVHVRARARGRGAGGNRECNNCPDVSGVNIHHRAHGIGRLVQKYGIGSIGDGGGRRIDDGVQIHLVAGGAKLSTGTNGGVPWRCLAERPQSGASRGSDLPHRVLD